MSEPTPLSAEQRERLESIHPMWSHQSGVRGHLPGEGCDVFPCLTNRALATIDAQATEIAALKGALEKTAEFLNGLAKADALPIGIADIQQEGARLDAIVLRVLAGKEAQR